MKYKQQKDWQNLIRVNFYKDIIMYKLSFNLLKYTSKSLRSPNFLIIFLIFKCKIIKTSIGNKKRHR